MKIAYGILCHTDAPHIFRLAKKLTVGTENHVFIHVDGKTDLVPFRELLNGCERVTLLENRVDVYWGGYAAIDATILLLRAALDMGGFQRFQLLQGLEYPILSNKEIDDFFEKHPKTEFIVGRNVSHYDNIKEQHKFRLYWYLDRPNRPHVWLLRKLNAVFIRLKWIPPFKPNYVLDCDGSRMEIHQGFAQFGLTMEAVRYIVDFHDRNPGYNRYFRSAYAVDECYFHTILYNSPFRTSTTYGGESHPDRVGDLRNLSYFEYPVHVILFTEVKDYEKLRNTGKLYFRKASSQSKPLLDYIDQIHQGM